MAVRNIKELAQYMQSTRSAIVRSHAENIIRITLAAEGFAKKNATQQFTGRNNRKLSGNLLNRGIFSGFDSFKPGQSLPRGVIGVRLERVPYGRIHELGGRIVPKKAKWLWIKQWGGRANRFRRMTPKEFVERLKNKDKRYKIIGKGQPGKIAVFQAREGQEPVVLFALAKRVLMPKRPYLQPAVEQAVDEYGQPAKKILRKNLRSLFNGSF